MLVDTLKAQKHLVTSGFSADQAEGIVEIVSTVNQQVATKEDVDSLQEAIEALRVATQEEIEALRVATQGAIEALRVATQEEIEALRMSIQRDIKALRVSTEKDINVVRQEMTATIYRAILIGAGLNIAAISLAVAIILGFG